MKRLLWGGALALLALVNVAWAADKSKRIADYDRIVAGIDRIVLMPPTFTVEKVGMFSDEAETDMARDIALNLRDAIGRIIVEGRFKLAPLDVSDSALAASPELRQRLGEITAAIDAAYGKVRDSKGKVLDVEFGGNLDFFADASGADYLLIVGGGGWFKKGGTRTMEFLLVEDAGAGSTTELRAMLVDATRGKVIWFNEVSKQDRDPRKYSQLFQVAQELMRPLTGKSALKPDKSHDGDIIEKYKAQERAGGK